VPDRRLFGDTGPTRVHTPAATDFAGGDQLRGQIVSR
jgi:hypothetical protein